MVVLQILNKVLKTSDISIINDNNLTQDMFFEYEDEFGFIMHHFQKYGKVPDKETFLKQFQDFNLIEVEESDRYLLDTLNEEYIYSKAVPIIQQAAELLNLIPQNQLLYI